MNMFNKEQKQKIVEAIQAAEQNTSGEIRVHFVKKTVGDIYEEGKKIFEQLGMTQTRDRNGILFLLSMKAHYFAILGDVGIHQKVHDEFWQMLRDECIKYFRQGDFCDGLCAAIEKCGMELKKYFPYQANDVNELMNEISEDV